MDFLQWADRVRAASPSISDLFQGDGSSHPFCSSACLESCCGLLGAIDRDNLGRECCEELVRLNVYHKLGEATRARWDFISQGMAQRAGTQAEDPAWLQQDLQETMSYVSERLRRACCTSEVAILMLRLAVRAACLGSSWFGPWDSVQAVHQLIRANAWSSLLHALRALLGTFGDNLANQYNAINIVSDVLHVSRPLFPSAPLVCCVMLHQRVQSCSNSWHACAGLLLPERVEHEQDLHAGWRWQGQRPAPGATGGGVCGPQARGAPPTPATTTGHLQRHCIAHGKLVPEPGFP